MSLEWYLIICLIIWIVYLYKRKIVIYVVVNLDYDYAHEGYFRTYKQAEAFMENQKGTADNNYQIDKWCIS